MSSPLTAEHRAMVNGVWQSSVPVTDRGFQFGDGLFETLRLHEGTLPLLALHMKRLTKGASVLRLKVCEAEIERELQRFIAESGLSDAAIKILITRGGGGMGYRPSADCSPCRTILARAPSPQKATGLSLKVCQTPLGSNPNLAGIKTLSCLEYVVAAAELDDAYDSGLLVSQQGHMVEALHHNLYWVENNTVYTPELDLCGVQGVMQGYLVDTVFPKLGLTLQKVKAKPKRLMYADEVFVSNAVTGVVGVHTIDTLQWPIGPLTQQIQQALNECCPNAFHPR